MASLGHTPQQIADELVLPESLAREFANRGYYGTVRHNAKAVYQFYFGWYDANPSHLNPLAPADAAPRYVEFMGGGATVLAKAQASFDKGDYRWVAEVLNHLVFAEPDNRAARELLARSYDQLGYQAESGPWRDAYLSGAWELRHGVPQGADSVGGVLDLLRNTPIERFLDTMAVRLDGATAADRHVVINLVLSDAGQSHVLELVNGVLHHWREPPRAGADATLTVTRALFIDMLTGQAGLRETLGSDALDVDGSRVALLSFLALFEQPDSAFPIVTP
jgi:alkyl sulfatase BDS1-like metallo-beta-lactamase superfamily hydrolase